MKYCWFVVVALFFTGCTFQNVSLSGTASGMDGGTINIVDLSGKNVFGTNITSGKFEIKQQQLPASGYYTFSIMSGQFPRDYEIYLEPGSYIITIPKNEGSYLNIKTTSKTQNKLSAYYNFEDSVMYKYRQEKDMWLAKLNNPNMKFLPDAEAHEIITKVESTRNREHGLHIAIMDMFIKKYPKNDIVPHIITDMDYQNDPYPYYVLYNKLTPSVKNSDEGKQVGRMLQQLIKQTDAREDSIKRIPQPVTR